MSMEIKTEKQCSKCEEIRSMDSFSINKSWCKPCMKEYNKAYREANAERLQIMVAEYQEKNKEKLRNQKEIYREENRELIRQRQNEYTARNRDAVNARQREFYKNNKNQAYAANRKRRAAKLNVESDNSTREDVWIKSNGTCHLCFQKWELNDKWHVDHMIPLQPVAGKPGSDTIDNLAVACIPCNAKKRNKIVESGSYAC